MPPQVYVQGKKIQIDPSRSKGKGGEADIYDIGGGVVLKLFKPPNHPDYVGAPLEQQGARTRIQTHQRKLPDFPTNLPPRVVTPINLATDQSGSKILGYTMRFLDQAELLISYSDKPFRLAGVSNQTTTEIFQDLHQTVGQIHQASVVIGDFNDLNVLVTGTEAYLIDADSFQFGQYLCQVFTDRFVDPLLCVLRTVPGSTTKSLDLVKPHTADSDWFAFSVMLMKALLFVGPFGGVYRPKNTSNKMTESERIINGISIFHPEVRYPKPATPYQVLPDELLHFWFETFEKGLRGVFPQKLLTLHWNSCPSCGTEHTRLKCPVCSFVTPVTTSLKTTHSGAVTVTEIFSTTGQILYATIQNDKLLYLYHEKDQYYRENGDKVVSGTRDPHIRYRIQGKRTIVAKSGSMVTIDPSGSVPRRAIDSYGRLPMFDANANGIYWIAGGRLEREGDYDVPFYIGDVLRQQTLFWVGPQFGFGFYRAGELSISFVFDAKSQGLNDNVKLDPVRGQLIDSTCLFSRDRAWFLSSTHENGKTMNRCTVIRRDGTIESTAEAEQSDGSWLGTIRGKTAIGASLYSPTDEGIVRVDSDATSGQLINPRVFTATEPYVDSSDNLFTGPGGIYVVKRQQILLLQLK